MITEIIYVICTLLGLLWAYNYLARPKGFPPGPPIFPLLGSLPIIGYESRSQTFLDVVRKWRQTYGNIFSLGLGNFRAVIIHDYELIKEAYNDSRFSGRPSLAPIQLIAGVEKRGLIASEGDQWVAQRRFALRNLRDFGFGKKSMEALAQEDILELIASFQKDLGHPIETSRRFSTAVLSSLWTIIAGEKFAHDDPKFEEVLTKLNAALSNTAVGGAVFFLPWLMNIAPGRTGWTRFKQAIPGIKELITSYIVEHKKTFQGNNLRDYMDVYLQEIANTQDVHSTFYGKAGEENLLVGILNLFGAGAETTSTTLNWSLLYLSRNKTIQKKFQKEIDEVIGNSRLPSLDDRDKMPYTAALTLEILRISSLTPFGVVHKTLEDVTFQSYQIPKDTIIMANLHAVHHDKEIWGDPETFRPERFLTKDGKDIDKNHPKVIAFSIGKRQCLGEVLARNNIFLFLTSLFQRFEILQDPASSDVIEERPAGPFRFPAPFKVIFKDRHQK